MLSPLNAVGGLSLASSSKEEAAAAEQRMGGADA
jgi:hypothetical protein